MTSFNYCSSGAIVHKAGADVNQNAATSAAILSEISEQVEAEVNMIMREDLVSVFATLPANVKSVLTTATAKLGGIELINYDLGGYPNRSYAESMIVVLRDGALRSLSLLKDQKGVTYLKTGE